MPAVTSSRLYSPQEYVEFSGCHRISLGSYLLCRGYKSVETSVACIIVGWKSRLQASLETCRPFVAAEMECAEGLRATGFDSPETPHLFALERTLLDMTASHLTDGVSYAAHFSVGQKKYIRYFDSGMLSGFLNGNGTPLKISPQKGDVSTNVWTEEDIATQTKRMEEMRANRHNRKGSCLPYTACLL